MPRRVSRELAIRRAKGAALRRLPTAFGNNEAGRVVSCSIQEHCMATNKSFVAVPRKRSQLKTKTMDQKHWTKRSRETGTFMDQKKAGKFKSVRREKSDR
jgi:hypothetical protein